MRERGGSQSVVNPGRKLDAEILEKRKEKEEQRVGKACKGTKQARCKRRARKPKQKLESSIPSRVATVVIPKFESSMHDARARVHRSELGSLLAVGPKEGYSTPKCWKKRKKQR